MSVASLSHNVNVFSENSVFLLTNPEHADSRLLYGKLCETASKQQKLAFGLIFERNTEDPFFISACKVLYSVLPTMFLQEADPDDIRAIPLEYLEEYIEALEVVWKEAIEKEPGFLSRELAQFAFSYAFDTLKDLIQELPQYTLTFPTILKKNFEIDFRFNIKDFAKEYLKKFSFFNQIVYHRATIGITELEGLIGFSKYFLEYRNKDSVSPSIDSSWLPCLNFMMRERSYFFSPGVDPTQKIIKKLQYQLPLNQLSLLDQLIFGLGDMIFCLNLETLKEEFYQFEIVSLLEQWKKTFPTKTHHEAVEMLAEYLSCHPIYQSKNKEDVFHSAIFYYKTWWFTGQTRHISFISMVDLALSWQILELPKHLLLDEKRTNEAISILIGEMEVFFPICPVNTQRCLSEIYKFRNKYHNSTSSKLKLNELFAQTKRELLISRKERLDFYIFGDFFHAHIEEILHFHEENAEVGWSLERDHFVEKIAKRSSCFPFLSDEFFKLGDMMFGFSTIKSHPYYRLNLISFLRKLHQEKPLMGHSQMIQAVEKKLLHLERYRNLPAEKLTHHARFFYKTWWYDVTVARTGLPYAETTLYHAAIEWEVTSILAEEKPGLLLETEALSLVRTRMAQKYPTYTFDDVHAKGYIKKWITQRRRILYEGIIKSVAYYLQKYQEHSIADFVTSLKQLFYEPLSYFSQKTDTKEVLRDTKAFTEETKKIIKKLNPEFWFESEKDLLPGLVEQHFINRVNHFIAITMRSLKAKKEIPYLKEGIFFTVEYLLRDEGLQVKHHFINELFNNYVKNQYKSTLETFIADFGAKDLPIHGNEDLLLVAANHLTEERIPVDVKDLRMMYQELMNRR